MTAYSNNKWRIPKTKQNIEKQEKFRYQQKNRVPSWYVISEILYDTFLTDNKET